MKELIINRFDSYNPNEFLPIFEGNEMINKNEFVAYKLKCALKGISKQLHKTANK